MLLKPTQNRRKHGLPLLCALRAPVSQNMSKRQVHSSELGIFIVLQLPGAGVVILPRNLRDLFREPDVHLDPLPGFLKVCRIAELVAYRLLRGRLLGIPRVLPLEHFLGEERVLLERVDAVRQSRGKRGVSLPYPASGCAHGFGGLGGSFEGFFGDWCGRGGKREGECDVKGFGALGEGREEKCDVGQRGGATDGEIEGDDEAEEGSEEAGEVD